MNSDFHITGSISQLNFIKRGFSDHTNMIMEAQRKHSPLIFALKRFFHSLIPWGGNFLGLGKSLEIIRSENIGHEIATIGFYISLRLSNEYDELEDENFRKTLYTNYNKGYQIVQEGNEMCLYTGNSEILHDNQEGVPCVNRRFF